MALRNRELHARNDEVRVSNAKTLLVGSTGQ